MDGVGGVPGAALRILGPKAAGLVLGTGGFRPNAASTISTFRGTLAGLFTVTYGATGLYTVAFTPEKFTFPADRLPVILPIATCADRTSTNFFEVTTLGAWDNSALGFVIEAHQGYSGGATAFEVPSDANNWIDFVLFGETK